MRPPQSGGRKVAEGATVTRWLPLRGKREPEPRSATHADPYPSVASASSVVDEAIATPITWATAFWTTDHTDYTDCRKMVMSGNVRR